MFKHPRPLKRQPQLCSTSPALVFVSASLAFVPLFLRPFRFLLHLLLIPNCPSLFLQRPPPPLHSAFPTRLHLLSLASPCVMLIDNICVAVNIACIFFPTHPPSAFYHLNISPKQLVYYLRFVSLPPISLLWISNFKQRIEEEEDQEIE